MFSGRAGNVAMEAAARQRAEDKRLSRIDASQREEGRRSADTHSQSPAPATGRQKAPNEPLSHLPDLRPGPALTRSPKPSPVLICPAQPDPARPGSLLLCHCHCISPQPALGVPAGKRIPPEPLLPTVLPHPTLNSPTSRPPHHPQRWEEGSQRGRTAI